MQVAMTKTLRAAMLAALLGAGQPAMSQDAGVPITSEQLAVLMFVDQGRAYGFQRMLARIQLDTVQAELERDQAILEQNEELYERSAIPLIELEISQLKDAWNRKQLIVAEKNLEAISAQFDAILEMARHFGGTPVPVATLYGAFRRGWEAGCDKGPDEVVAMQAWAAYAEKSLERGRQLNARGSLSLNALLDREAQLRIARSNFENRQARLDRCRTALFPSLEEIMAIEK
jgi:hypothetical protein